MLILALYLPEYSGESDCGLRMFGDDLPWMIGETGYSDSLNLIKNRAKCWLEHTKGQVSLLYLYHN